MASDHRPGGTTKAILVDRAWPALSAKRIALARSLPQRRLCRGAVEAAMQPSLHIGGRAQIHRGRTRHYAREVEIRDREVIDDQVLLGLQMLIENREWTRELLQRVRRLLGVALPRR